MAPLSETRSWDAIVSTTYDAYRFTLIDNIFKSNPAMLEFKARGATRTEDGGVQIVEPLLYGKNNTIKSYEGYDTLDTTPQEGITSALFPWSQVAGSITISRKERRQNSGKHQIINLVSAKIKQCEMSMQEKFSEYFFAAGKYNASQTTKDPAGLLSMVAEVPGNFDVGAIDTSVETWFRNKVQGNGGTTLTWLSDTGDTPAAATGINALQTLYNNCSKGPGGMPKILLASQYLFEQYQSGVLPLARVPANQDAADLGFPNLRFNGSTLYWDENYRSASLTTAAQTLTEAGCIMLNPDFISFVSDSQTEFIRTPFIRPANQDADTAQILWMGNMTVNNRRKHGILHDSNITQVA